MWSSSWQAKAKVSNFSDAIYTYIHIHTCLETHASLLKLLTHNTVSLLTWQATCWYIVMSLPCFSVGSAWSVLFGGICPCPSLHCNRFTLGSWWSDTVKWLGFLQLLLAICLSYSFRLVLMFHCSGSWQMVWALFCQLSKYGKLCFHCRLPYD